MKYEFLSSRMRGQVYGFLDLLLPSIQNTQKPHKSLISLLLFTRSLSCALNVVEPYETTSDFAVNKTKDRAVQFHQGFDKSSSKNLSPDRAKSRLLSDSNVRSKPVKLGSKERLRKYSSLLRNCAAKGSLNEGRLIHGHVIKGGLELDSHLWVSLINAYAKCGSIVYARRVLDVMPERDVVSWTALISGFLAEGYGSDGVNLFNEMRKEGVRPNEFALATALKACSMCWDLDFGKQVHVEAMKLGFSSDLFVGSALVDLYAKCGEMGLADRVFCGMPEQNAVSWNALLNGYAERGDGKKVMDLFCSLKDPEMKFSKFTLSTVLKGCANSGYTRAGQLVHSLTIRLGCVLDEFLGCTLVDMYSKCGLPYEAVQVFKRIKDPDVVAWSAIVTCLDQQRHSQEAVVLFNLMRHSGVRPNQFTLTSIVSAATDIGDLNCSESIHACIIKYGFESDVLVGNALLTMYMQNGRLLVGDAFLSGFQDHETCDLGPKIFSQMLVKGFKPNMYAFNSILKSCSSLSDVGLGKQVHAHIVKNSLNGIEFVGTALVDMYAKTGCLEDADLAFNGLITRDLFAWTTIIAGHAQADRAETSLKWFRKMQQEGVKPNEFTLASCLSGCSRMATLENGRLLHSMAVKAGHLCDMFVSTALVDMYGKCGCIENAEAVFMGLVLRDTISWNAMIGGYVQHGQGGKALEAFRMMLDEGIVPDEVTFIVVLSACSHMGLIEEGKEHFSSMSKVYGITPIVEHYACMVDILGRAGKFTEVESFITEMNITPNALIWETLLGACRMHGNVEFGEKVAVKLLELEPKIDSNYILLSNIFATKGRWDDFRKVRALMTSRGVKKEPGCSWVELEGQVHIFMSQNGSHPKANEIYRKWDELVLKLTSVGYMPKTEHVLLNVTDTEKLDYLYHHSERLAFAFALISTNPAKTIRIFKNTHICGDCHDVMKLLSNITNREIVVRDINHFHHFKSGTCSCQDFG